MRRTLLIILALAVSFALVWRAVSEQGSAPKGEAVRVLFVGDVMLDRTMRAWGEEKGYDHLFSCVKDFLSGFDLVVANLEGPVTLHDSVSRGSKPGDPGNTTFTFSPESLGALYRANIRAVNLGNNHMLDFGREGVESTKAFLDGAGIAYFGVPHGDVWKLVSVKGMTIALVNFNQFLGQGDPDRTDAAVRAARSKSDFVAVYAHWGKEYESATDYQRHLAYRFIDAGADAVVGSHPHVIQEIEEYKGKKIYYSLGNFVFDQYWSQHVRTGLGVGLSIRGSGSVDESLVYFESSRDGRVCPSDQDL